MKLEPAQEKLNVHTAKKFASICIIITVHLAFPKGSSQFQEYYSFKPLNNPFYSPSIDGKTRNREVSPIG